MPVKARETDANCINESAPRVPYLVKLSPTYIIPRNTTLIRNQLTDEISSLSTLTRPIVMHKHPLQLVPEKSLYARLGYSSPNQTALIATAIGLTINGESIPPHSSNFLHNNNNSLSNDNPVITSIGCPLLIL
ncbi:hypothetical protein Tco_0359508 [Tanacetum coccineum]